MARKRSIYCEGTKLFFDGAYVSDGHWAARKDLFTSKLKLKPRYQSLVEAGIRFVSDGNRTRRNSDG